jgi:hypothetical protein
LDIGKQEEVKMAFGQGYSPGGGFTGQENYTIFDAQKDKDADEVKSLLHQMNRLQAEDQMAARTNSNSLNVADNRQDNLLTSGRDYRRMNNLIDYLGSGKRMDEPLSSTGAGLVNFDPEKYQQEYALYSAKNKLATHTQFRDLWGKRQGQEANEILRNLMDEKSMKRMSDKDFNLMLRDNPYFKRWFMDLDGGPDSPKQVFQDETGYEVNYRTSFEGVGDWTSSNPMKTTVGLAAAGGVSYKMRSVLNQAKLLEGNVATAQKGLDYLTTRPINELTGKPFKRNSEKFKDWMKKRGQNPITGDPERTGLRSIKKAKDALKNAKKLSEPYGKWTKKLAKTVPGILPYMAPDVGQRVGQHLGGDTGEALGHTLGTGVMLRQAVAPSLKTTGKQVKDSFLKYLSKKFPGRLAKAAAKGGAIAMADSPLPGPMDLLGLAVTIGISAGDLYGLYQDWKKAVQ